MNECRSVRHPKPHNVPATVVLVDPFGEVCESAPYCDDCGQKNMDALNTAKVKGWSLKKLKERS